MKEINTQDLNQISGGGFALSGIGGGNPGRYTAGNIGIAHINRVGTFHKPASAMITFTKKNGNVKKTFSSLLHVLSKCMQFFRYRWLICKTDFCRQ